MAGTIKFEKYKRLGKTVFFATNENTSEHTNFSIGYDTPREFHHKPISDLDSEVLLSITVVRDVEFYKDYSAEVEFMDSIANVVYLDSIGNSTDSELLAEGYEVLITYPSSKPVYGISRQYTGELEQGCTESSSVKYEGRILDPSITLVKAVLVTEHKEELI